MKTGYRLLNVADGNLFDDKGWTLKDPDYDGTSLLRAVYEKRQLEVKDDSLGLFKYADWLPITRYLDKSSSTVTFKSKKLAGTLGLSNLYISFSGYWPEIGASMTTCSFKETEAYSVCARMSPHQKGVMVVASAGNTARAFARVCSNNNIPLLLVVPEDNLDALWFNERINNCVKLICTPTGSDYYDAIDLSNTICCSDYFYEEGGAKNIARRDGMGTTVLSAATYIGKIPEYYFQAIGSGTGTIAAWEANLRLIEDGRFGNNKMVLIPSQNSPFTPICDAWKSGRREILFDDEQRARENALKITARVLANRRPPYSITGGLYDALKECNGDVESVTNSELAAACKLFEKEKGIDIHPASGVALAGMIKSLKAKNIDKESIIMLNITGGGEKRLLKEIIPFYLKPDLIIDNKTDRDRVIKKAEALFN